MFSWNIYGQTDNDNLWHVCVVGDTVLNSVLIPAKLVLHWLNQDKH